MVPGKSGREKEILPGERGIGFKNRARRKGKDKGRSTQCREGHLRSAGIEANGKGVSLRTVSSQKVSD